MLYKILPWIKDIILKIKNEVYAFEHLKVFRLSDQNLIYKYVEINDSKELCIFFLFFCLNYFLHFQALGGGDRLHRHHAGSAPGLYQGRPIYTKEKYKSKIGS